MTPPRANPESGPLWRRLLAGGIAAGVGLSLAATGLPARAAGDVPASDERGPAMQTNPPAVQAALDAAPEWIELRAALEAADEVAAGRRGDYPFDKAGRDALLSRLAAAPKAVDALAGRGLLPAPAAELLKSEIAALERGVQSKRPTEMMDATCYKPMRFEPWRDGAKRLAERVDALERLAAAGTVAPALLDRVRAAIASDLDLLTAESLPLLQGAERAQAEKNVARARKALGKLR